MPSLRSPLRDEVRFLAWNILRRIEESGAYADLALENAFLRSPELRALDRAFITEMVLGTLRWRGRLDWIIRRAVKAPHKKVEPRLLHLLRLASYQIHFMDRVPDSAAVDESVRLAKSVFKNERIAGFANALLRAIARQKGSEDFPPFASQPEEHLIHALSHPRWLAKRWLREFGPETARLICAANNKPPPFTIRANTLRISRESLQEKLLVQGIASRQALYSPEGLVLEKSFTPAEEKLFQQGFYFVQDEASQLIAHLLAPQPGERILDACAAPGGKTTHIVQLMDGRGEVLALDLHEPRLELIRRNCLRLGISSIQVLPGDAARPLPFPADIVLDRILVDAPCTSLGILHRHPEIKWQRGPEDPLRLQAVQLAILGNISSRLKPGGILVYSTCTLTPEENDRVVELFLEAHPDFRREDLRSMAPESLRPLLDEKGFLRTYPAGMIGADGYRLDGFFAARFKKMDSPQSHRGHSAAKAQPNPLTPALSPGTGERGKMTQSRKTPLSPGGGGEG